MILWPHAEGASSQLFGEPTLSEGRTIPEPWISVDEVARDRGVAKDSNHRWIEAKALPPHRVGRLWKLKLSEIDKWVRAGGASDGDKRGSIR